MDKSVKGADGGSRFASLANLTEDEGVNSGLPKHGEGNGWHSKQNINRGNVEEPVPKISDKNRKGEIRLARMRI